MASSEEIRSHESSTVRARKIYWAVMFLAVLIGLYFYVLAPEQFSRDFLLFFAVVPFGLFTTGFHGQIAHLLSAEIKERMIVYPILMGIIWSILFLLHVFLVMPLVCPGFLG